jgi:AcrR family transcriptional regulator
MASVSTRTASPGRMPAQQRREQLLDATKAIVDRDGFHAVSIEAVAREAGITRPIVYGHFRDLGGLLEALVEREGARALAQLEQVLPDVAAKGDPLETLLGGLRAYLQAARADPATWRLVLMPPEGAPAILRERIAAGRAAIITELAEAVPPLLGSQPDPELTAHMLSTLSDETVRLHLSDPDGYPVDRLLDMARWFLGRVMAD